MVVPSTSVGEGKGLLEKRGKGAGDVVAMGAEAGTWTSGVKSSSSMSARLGEVQASKLTPRGLYQ